MAKSSQPLPLALVAILGLSGCLKLSFRKPLTMEETLKEREIQALYIDVKSAFASGNAEALAELFDAEIKQPMTRPELLDWGRKFFSEHGSASFQVDKLKILELGHEHALVEITYRVETKDGKGNFGGTELDTLTKRGKRWAVSSWEKAGAR